MNLFSKSASGLTKFAGVLGAAIMLTLVPGMSGMPEMSGEVLAQTGGQSNTQNTGVKAGSSRTDILYFDTRISELEIELRNLTGQLETLGHRIDQSASRLDKLVVDVEFRLTALERKAGLSAAPKSIPDSTPDSGNSSSPASASQPTSSDGQAGRPLAITPKPDETGAAKDLGQVSSSAVAETGVTARKLLPDGTARQQYDHALSLLRSGDYVAAEKAFLAFLSANPKDSLAANAQYWLGESYYVRTRYADAAQAFLTGVNDHPDGSKYTASMLKLAMSLFGMGEKKDACGTLNELIRKHSDTSGDIIDRAKREKTRIGCR